MKKDLEVHIGGSFDSIAKRVTEAWHRAERGEPVNEDHLTFSSWDALAKVMTGKRLELLRRLHQQPAVSVAALARDLGRDYKRVHEDVEALAAAGLLARDETGLRTEYDKIHTVIAM
jgi:predicted transcriptional regulator